MLSAFLMGKIMAVDSAPGRPPRLLPEVTIRSKQEMPLSPLRLSKLHGLKAGGLVVSEGGRATVFFTQFLGALGAVNFDWKKPHKDPRGGTAPSGTDFHFRVLRTVEIDGPVISERSVGIPHVAVFNPIRMEFDFRRSRPFSGAVLLPRGPAPLGQSVAVLERGTSFMVLLMQDASGPLTTELRSQMIVQEVLWGEANIARSRWGIVGSPPRRMDEGSPDPVAAEVLFYSENRPCVLRNSNFTNPRWEPWHMVGEENGLVLEQLSGGVAGALPLSLTPNPETNFALLLQGFRSGGTTYTDEISLFDPVTRLADEETLNLEDLPLGRPQIYQMVQCVAPLGRYFFIACERGVIVLSAEPPLRIVQEHPYTVFGKKTSPLVSAHALAAPIRDGRWAAVVMEAWGQNGWGVRGYRPRAELFEVET